MTLFVTVNDVMLNERTTTNEGGGVSVVTTSAKAMSNPETEVEVSEGKIESCGRGKLC